MRVVHIQPGSPLPKFCANCKYFKSGKYFEAACTHPSAANIDLVFGLLEPQCSEARKPHGKCGPDAKLFAELVGDAVSSVSQSI